MIPVVRSRFQDGTAVRGGRYPANPSQIFADHGRIPAGRSGDIRRGAVRRAQDTPSAPRRDPVDGSPVYRPYRPTHPSTDSTAYSPGELARRCRPGARGPAMDRGGFGVGAALAAPAMSWRSAAATSTPTSISMRSGRGGPTSPPAAASSPRLYIMQIIGVYSTGPGQGFSDGSVPGPVPRLRTAPTTSRNRQQRQLGRDGDQRHDQQPKRREARPGHGDVQRPEPVGGPQQGRQRRPRGEQRPGVDTDEHRRQAQRRIGEGLQGQVGRQVADGIGADHRSRQQAEELDDGVPRARDGTQPIAQPQPMSRLRRQEQAGGEDQQRPSAPGSRPDRWTGGAMRPAGS